MLTLSSTTVRLVVDGLNGLAVAGRLEPVGEIWASIIMDPAAVPMSEAQWIDLQRRLGACVADREPGEIDDDIIAGISARL